MSLEQKFLSIRLAPDVRTEHPPELCRPGRPCFDRVIGKHTKGRNDIFFEILILVITPDHHDIWREIVQYPSCLPEPRHQRFPMTARGTRPTILTPFLPHCRRPIFWPAILLR